MSDPARSRSNRLQVVAIAVLFVLSISLFGPLLPRILYVPYGDHIAHIEGAQQLGESGTLTWSHFLYHALTVVLHYVPPFPDWIAAGIGASQLALIAAALAVFFYLARGRSAPQDWAGAARLVAVTLGLLLVWPIHIFTLAQRSIYLGYIAPNPFHSPTYFVLKPLAVPLFGLAAIALGGRRERRGSKTILLLALLTVLSTLAKPSLIICLIPAVGLWALLRAARRRNVDWALIVGGLALPGLFLLAWQHAFTFGSVKERIVFAPLAVVRLHSDWLLPRFVLSLIFPLTVSVAYFRKARGDRALGLAWSCFAFGSFYFYFLALSGEWMADADFFWSAEISLFLVFLAAADLVLRLGKSDNTLRPLICWTAFGLHVACGVIAYWIHFTHQFVN